MVEGSPQARFFSFPKMSQASANGFMYDRSSMQQRLRRIVDDKAAVKPKWLSLSPITNTRADNQTNIGTYDVETCHRRCSTMKFNTVRHFINQ